MLTGHRSEFIRAYKRSSDEQKVTVSDIITKKPAIESKSRDAT